MNQYYIAIVGFLSFGMLLVSLEIISRKFSFSAEYIRRISHIFAALFTIFFSFYLPSVLLLLILGIFSVIMFLSRLLKIFKHIHGVSRRTIGEELLPIGFIGAYLITNGNSNLFITSVLLVGIADPIAGIIMERYKRHFFGILAFALVSFILLVMVTHISFWIAIMLALILALVERISSHGTDNFSIPITAALLLLYFQR